MNLYPSCRRRYHTISQNSSVYTVVNNTKLSLSKCCSVYQLLCYGAYIDGREVFPEKKLQDDGNDGVWWWWIRMCKYRALKE